MPNRKRRRRDGEVMHKLLPGWVFALVCLAALVVSGCSRAPSASTPW